MTSRNGVFTPSAGLVRILLPADARRRCRCAITIPHRGELEVAGGFLPRVVYGVVADMAIIGMQLRQLFGKGASIAVGEFPISGGTISGIREKDSPGN